MVKVLYIVNRFVCVFRLSPLNAHFLFLGMLGIRTMATKAIKLVTINTPEDAEAYYTAVLEKTLKEIDEKYDALEKPYKVSATKNPNAQAILNGMELTRKFVKNDAKNGIERQKELFIEYCLRNPEDYFEEEEAPVATPAPAPKKAVVKKAAPKKAAKKK